MRRSHNLLFLFITLAALSACGVRKSAAPTPAARAAEAMSNLSSRKLYNFITSWSGVRYRLGGMDKSGIDCSGFVLKLQKEIYGLDVPRRSVDQSKAIKEKKLTKLEEGDLLFFSFGGGEIDHVGVYLNNNYFVHASTTRGVVVDDLSLPAYQRAFVTAGSVKR